MFLTYKLLSLERQLIKFIINHTMKFVINNKGKNIELEVRKLGFIARFFGMMFRSRKTENLLFDFGEDIHLHFHSLFVFFPFLIIWLDSQDRILDFRAVKPFTLNICTGKFFRKVVEIPINEKNKIIINKIVKAKSH